MTHHKYISIIALVGGVSFLALFLIILRLSPDHNMAITLPFFFLTLFLALGSTFTVLGFYFRLWLFKNEIFYKHINISLRQGFFLGGIATLCLVFQMMRVLTWWSSILLLIIFVLLEFYFSSRDSELL